MPHVVSRSCVLTLTRTRIGTCITSRALRRRARRGGGRRPNVPVPLPRHGALRQRAAPAPNEQAPQAPWGVGGWPVGRLKRILYALHLQHGVRSQRRSAGSSGVLRLTMFSSVQVTALRLLARGLASGSARYSEKKSCICTPLALSTRDEILPYLGKGANST